MIPRRTLWHVPVLALAACAGSAIPKSAPPPASPPLAPLTERYRTIEIAPAAANPRWSPDGRHAAYDIPGAEPRTVVVEVREDHATQVAELRGYGAVFSPDGRRIAWLHAPDLRGPVPQARVRVRVRELATGAERDIPGSGVIRAVVWSRGEVVPWLADEGVRVSPTGTHLVFAAEGGLGVITLDDELQRTYPGSGSPAFSVDGSTLVFVSTDGDRHAIHRLRLDERGEGVLVPETLAASTDHIASLTVSPNGDLVAFQRMTGHGPETWIAGDGAGPRRLTRDMLRDVPPQFQLAPEDDWALSPDEMRLLLVAERDDGTATPGRGLYLIDLGRPVTFEGLSHGINMLQQKGSARTAMGPRNTSPPLRVLRGFAWDAVGCLERRSTPRPPPPSHRRSIPGART
jgi:hypothetical protein